jgi:ribosome biogenesis protein NSA1
VDTRTGNIVYGYHGVAGSITAAASAPGILVSTSRDRYVRVHSVYPPAEPGKAQGEKGEVLEKTYFKSIPTAVVWDQGPSTHIDGVKGADDCEDEDDEDVWQGMQEIDDDDNTPKRKKGSKKVTP